MTRYTILINTAWHNQGCALEENVLASAGVDAQCLAMSGPDEFRRLASEADAAIIDSRTPMDRELISLLAKCRLLVTQNIGFDHIDLEAAREFGIPVANVPDYCLEEVSDHTLALILASVRQVARYDREVRGGLWKSATGPAPRLLRHMVLGVLGFGRLGRLVAAKAKPLFQDVAAYSPHLDARAAAESGVRAMNNPEDLIREADVLTLHLPAAPSKQPILDAARLALFKPSAILVNTARGRLVDEGALYDALQSGRLRAFAADVLAQEPPPTGHPLLTLPQVTITPHAGWYSDQADVTVRTNAAWEVVRALTGEPIRNRVV